MSVPPTIQQAAEAAREGNVQLFAELSDAALQQLCAKRDEDGRSLFHTAVAAGNQQLAELLLARGGAAATVDAQDEAQWTPLMSAVSAGHESLVRLLLSLAVDVNKTTAQGRTALHYAASKGRVAIIRLLIQNDASSAKQKDCTGALPLHRAASAGHAEAVKALLGKGATPKHMVDARDGSKSTALLLACGGGHQAAAAALAAAGADVEAEDAEGVTPLAAAAVHGNLRQILAGLASGEMDIDELDQRGI